MSRIELLKEWVAALRSGEYRQGKNMLQNTNGTYCCLGVACEVARKHGIEVQDRYVKVNDHRTIKVLRGLDLCTQGPVRQAFGITECGQLSDDSCLSELNDSGATFSEIADIIEKELINEPRITE